MFRLLTTCGESCLPSRSHGPPGATCMSTNVMTMTKKRTGIIQSRRLMMKITRLAVRPRGIQETNGKAPLRRGAPAVTPKSLLAGNVHRRGRGHVADPVVVQGGLGVTLDLGRDQQELLVLVQEHDGRFLLEDLLRLAVSRVAVCLG